MNPPALGPFAGGKGRLLLEGAGVRLIMAPMRPLPILLFALSAAAPAVAQDTIRFRDPGRPRMTGEITAMNFRVVEIEIDVGGLRVPQKVNSREILEIEIDPGRKSHDFYSGEEAMNRGDYAKAAERFGLARKDPREVVKQTAAMNVVRCHFLSGDLPAALNAIKAFRQEKPETYYLRETYEYEYRCYLQQGDAAGMARTVDEFEKKGRSEKLDEWTKSAEILRARLHEFQGKWAEALGIFSRHARDPEVGEEAALGELRCLTRMKNWSPLKAKAEALIVAHKGKKGSERVLMGAYNARGESLLQAGNPKEALFDFMQGVAVLSQGSETSGEHERALALAGIACAQIATHQKNPVYKERARELLADLERLYPNSPLREELDKAIREIK